MLFGPQPFRPAKDFETDHFFFFWSFSTRPFYPNSQTFHSKSICDSSCVVRSMSMIINANKKNNANTIVLYLTYLIVLSIIATCVNDFSFRSIDLFVIFLVYLELLFEALDFPFPRSALASLQMVIGHHLCFECLALKTHVSTHGTAALPFFQNWSSKLMFSPMVRRHFHF